MRLDLTDTLALLERLLEKEPETSKPGGFTVRLRRLHDLVEETQCAEPTLAAIAGFVFPGVSTNSLRATLGEFRKCLSEAATAAGLSIELIRPDARKVEASEIICYFEGIPLPSAKGKVTRETILNLEQTRLESPRSFPDVIRIFVSFSTKDEAGMTELVDMLKKTWGTQRSHQVEFWIFHKPSKGGLLAGEDNVARVKQEIATCPFGLMLFSPDYMASEFIRSHELSAYFPEIPGKHPILVNLRNSGPGTPHLPAETSGKFIFSKDSQSYSEMRGKARKEQFAMALNDHIEALCKKHFSIGEPEETQAAVQTKHVTRPDSHLSPPGLDGTKLIPPIHDSDKEKGITTVDDLVAWAMEPRRAHYFALLGEVGSGKTTAVLMFAKALAAKQEQIQAYYFDMRYVNYAGLLEQTNKRPTLEQIIGAILSRSGDTKAKAGDYIRAVREHRAVLIFDGLDEIFVSLDDSQQDALMKELLGALPLSSLKSEGAGKILLACRTHYFRTQIAERGSFTLQGREGIDMGRTNDERASMERARMLPFCEAQIKAYFQANIPDMPFDKIWDLLSEIHNLRELATRPYLLNLIRCQLPALNNKLERNEKVHSVDLYQNFTEDWSNERNKFHNIISAQDKLVIMGRLAAYLWREEKKTLLANELEGWLLDTLISLDRWVIIYGDQLKPGKTEGILSDFRAASFIARWDGDVFRFAHTSLQEFFLATHLVTALEEGSLDEWMLPQLNRETLDFAAELFVQRMEGSPAVKRRLEESLGSLLGESVAGRSENAFAFYLRLHRMEEFDWVPERLDLRKLDLTAWDIKGSGEKPLVFPDADFSEACLIRSRFRYVEMNDSLWKGADLCSAEFLECQLTRADFSSVRLEGGMLRDCQLSRSKCGKADTAGLCIELPNWDEETHRKWATSRAQISSIGSITGVAEAQWIYGHYDSVNSVALSGDGKLVASGSADGKVRLWDGETGKCLRVLDGLCGIVNSVALRGGCKLIVSGSDDTVRVWDRETGICVRLLRGHDGMVTSVALSEDGKRIVSGSNDNTVRVWDGETGACLRVLGGQCFPVRNVALSRDGKQVVSGSFDQVRVWDGEVGKCLRVLGGHCFVVRSVALSGDGKWIVSGSDDKVRAWDGETGMCVRLLKGHDGMVTSVAVSEDGKWIVSGSDDNTVRIWERETGKCLRVLKGHDDVPFNVAMSVEGKQVVDPTQEDLELIESMKETYNGRITHRTRAGVELDIILLKEDGYVVLEKANDDAPWRIARAKGEYWRYVNYATDGPEGRVLWSADVLGRVPEE